jgi:hypothetical protein
MFTNKLLLFVGAIAITISKHHQFKDVEDYRVFQRKAPHSKKLSESIRYKDSEYVKKRIGKKFYDYI